MTKKKLKAIRVKKTGNKAVFRPRVTREVPLHKAKESLSRYIEMVSLGDNYIITKHGQAVAELRQYTPVRKERQLRAIESLKAMSANRKPMNNKDLKALITEGRE